MTQHLYEPPPAPIDEPFPRSAAGDVLIGIAATVLAVCGAIIAFAIFLVVA